LIARDLKPQVTWPKLCKFFEARGWSGKEDVLRKIYREIKEDKSEYERICKLAKIKPKKTNTTL